MKKQIKNILVLALGLITTAASAQSWDASTRTRTESFATGDADAKSWTTQRTRLGSSWDGDGWSMRLSGNHNIDWGSDKGTFGIYQANASFDIPFGLNLTAGRMALHYGDGRIIGNDDWGNDGLTHDGYVLRYKGLVNLDMGVDGGNGPNWMYAYLNKGGENWNLDGAYLDDNKSTIMGTAIDYTMMDGALSLGLDYWMQATNDDGDDATEELGAGLMAVSANYAVNDNISVGAGMDMFSADDGANGKTGNWKPSWGDVHQFNGAMDLAAKNMSGAWNDMYFNLGYGISSWDLGLAYHMISADDEKAGGNEIDLSIANTLNDNINYGFGYSIFTPNDDSDGSNWMYLQISVTP